MFVSRSSASGYRSPSITYCRGGPFDLDDIVAGELDSDGADVLFESVQFGGPRYRCNPWSLSEEPGDRDLRRSGALAAADHSNEVDDGLVRLAGFDREARQPVACSSAIQLSESGLSLGEC